MITKAKDGRMKVTHIKKKVAKLLFHFDKLPLLSPEFMYGAYGNLLSAP